MKYLVIVILLFVESYTGPVLIKSDDPDSKTIINVKNVTSSKIDYKLLSKPHHLFIGRCDRRDEILHQENIILTNDGKSHVSANIRMNIEGPVYITCVNIHDEIPNGDGGYPSFSAGGVGHNFVEFNILTNYGKGFHFFTQIYGYTKKDKQEENDGENIITKKIS